MPAPTSTASRKRTRSTNVSEIDDEHQTPTSSIVSSNAATTAPPKRRRNNPPSIPSRTNYSLRNRSITPDSPPPSTETSTSSQRYNLRPRRSHSQIHLPEVSDTHPTTVRRRPRHRIPSAVASIAQHEQLASSIVQPRQYRLLYISNNDNQPTTVTNADDREATRAQVSSRRQARSIAGAGHHTRSRTITDPTSSNTDENPVYPNGGVAHVRLNRAIEIVIDSFQSLEGAVNNFDQLVFGLIYGRLNTRTEMESIEGMIRLSRILNLNFPSRLTQDEIDALPTIKFMTKLDCAPSILLVEKCPICLTEFNEQETINKLHCTHLFHLQCIATWLNENDSCPTCRRKVNGN